jgi:hypothetical protein
MESVKGVWVIYRSKREGCCFEVAIVVYNGKCIAVSAGIFCTSAPLMYQSRTEL